MSIPAERRVDRLNVGIAQLLLLFSAFAYILLAVAEQGGIGSQLTVVPSRPLPFERARVFGLDLSNRSSIDALAYLQAADWQHLALITIPVDAEIVASLAVPERAGEGTLALQGLVDAAGEVPVTMCFRRPVTPLSDAELAEIVIDRLSDQHTEQVAYIAACDGRAEPGWQEALAVGLDAAGAGPQDLIPLSVGASIQLEDVESADELRASNLRSFAGSQYVAPRVTTRQPMDEMTLRRASTAVRDAAQIALIMLMPTLSLDPVTLARSTEVEPVPTSPLPEGFTSVTSLAGLDPAVWESTSIGTVNYVRAGSPDAQLQVEFIGTELYVYALRSPDAGVISIWLDSPALAPDAAPHALVDLESAQARDAAVPVVSGLPAERHSLTIVVEEGDVVLSGVFVSGKPEAVWSAALADIGLIAIAVGAGAVVARSAVRSIRRRTLPADADRPPYSA